MCGKDDLIRGTKGACAVPGHCRVRCPGWAAANQTKWGVQQVDQEARNFFKDKVYFNVIPRNVRLSEAPSHGEPCVFYDPLCSGSKAYSHLAREFLKKKNKMGSAA